MSLSGKVTLVNNVSGFVGSHVVCILPKEGVAGLRILVNLARVEIRTADVSCFYGE